MGVRKTAKLALIDRRHLVVIQNRVFFSARLPMAFLGHFGPKVPPAWAIDKQCCHLGAEEPAVFDKKTSHRQQEFCDKIFPRILSTQAPFLHIPPIASAGFKPKKSKLSLLWWLQCSKWLVGPVHLLLFAKGAKHDFALFKRSLVLGSIMTFRPSCVVSRPRYNACKKTVYLPMSDEVEGPMNEYT